MVKHEKLIFSGTQKPMTLKVDMQLWVRECYQVYSNAVSDLTLTYFIAKSILVPYVLYEKK